MTEGEIDRYRRVYRKIRERGALMHFMRGTPSGTGVVEIENELTTLANQGKHFQVIVIDYLNLLRPSERNSDSDWQEQGVLAWDLVKLSQMGYIVVSAIQSRREGADREVLRPADLGRSVVIAQAVTNIIAINQTEAEREQGRIRLGPVALRDSEVTASQVELSMNLWKMRISDDINRVLDRLAEDAANNVNV
jgi:replicative DNA helicase